MQIPLKHHALFGFVNIVHGFLMETPPCFFYIFTKHVKGVHIILSYLHVLFQNISSEMSTKKNVDRKKSCLARHPSSTFDVIQASRSSPIIGAVVQNYFWGFTNITLSKIDSVEVKFLSQAPEFLKNHLILSGNAMFAPFLLGMPRKITKITAMFDPGRIPKWQRKWSRVLHPEMMISTLPLN